MYNYRLTAFLSFTSAFLFSELCAALLVWGILSYKAPATSQETIKPDRKPTKEELRHQIETVDKAEEEEFQRLQAVRFEKQAPGGRSMGKKGSVLAVLKDISSEEDEVEVEDVKPALETKIESEHEEEEGWQNEASKDGDDLDTLGGVDTFLSSLESILIAGLVYYFWRSFDHGQLHFQIYCLYCS